MDGETLLSRMFTVLVVLIVAGAFLGSGLFGASNGQISDEEYTLEVDGGSSTIGTGVTSEIDSIGNVEATLGTAAKFDGDESTRALAQTDVNAGSSWSVCAVVEAHDTSINRTIYGANLGIHDVVVWYDAENDGYRLWVYNASSRESRGEFIGASDATTPTVVCGERTEGGAIQIARNTTTAMTLDGSGAPAPPAANWNGTIDELRLREPLAFEQRQELVAEPATAVSGGAPQLLINFDSADRSVSSVPVHWSSGSVSLNGVELVDGVQGPELTAGTDYEVSGATFSVLSGGVLEPSGEVIYLGVDVSDVGLLPFIPVMIAMFVFGIIAIPIVKELR